MDVDPVDPVDVAGELSPDRASARLTARVAVTVALLATFMGICKVKDDNIVQAMQQAQAHSLDDWNFYQARNIREEVGKAALVELRLAAESAPAAVAPKYAEAVASYEALVKEQEAKKAELQAEAKAETARYDALNYRDDQFDLTDALLALAISLLAITALTHHEWLYFLAMVPTAAGLLMGVAGLAGWHVHPDAIANLLG